MNLQEALNVWEKELYRIWDIYNAQQKELDKYRGVVIDDKNIREINKLINEIQETMAQLWPSFEFILGRAHNINTVTVAYNAFINDIVNAGAKEAYKGDIEA